MAIYSHVESTSASRPVTPGCAELARSLFCRHATAGRSRRKYHAINVVKLRILSTTDSFNVPRKRMIRTLGSKARLSATTYVADLMTVVIMPAKSRAIPKTKNRHIARSPLM